MSSYDINRTYGGTTFAGRISRVFTGIFAGLTAWNDARITRKSLSRLSLRELEDIGLTRADIDVIAARGSRF